MITTDKSALALATDKSALEIATQDDTADAKNTANAIGLLRVEDDRQFQFASSFLLSIKAKAKAIDDERKRLVGPLQDAVRNVNAFFQAPIKELERAEGILKAKIAAYSRQLQAARVVQAQQGLPVLAAPAEAPGVSIRKVRKWRITNADLVPRWACSPDAAKIDEHLRNGGLEAISGIEFYDEDRVIASRRGAQ